VNWITSLRLLSALGVAVVVIVSLATSSPAKWWQVPLPLATAMLFVFYAATISRFQTAFLTVQGVLPWLVVVGSDYVHVPLVSMVPYAHLSSHWPQFVGLISGVCILDSTLVWVWYQSVRRQQCLSLMMTWILLSLFVAVYSVLFLFSFGVSWYFVIALTVVYFVCSTMFTNSRVGPSASRPTRDDRV